MDSKKYTDLNYINGLLTKLIVCGFTLSAFNDPNKKDVMQFNFYYLTRIKDEVDLHEMMTVKYRQINSLRLLILYQAKDCASLGLWPGASKVIVSEISADFENFDTGADELVKTFMQACGNFQYTNHAYSGNSGTSYAIAKEFRSLATRFAKK